MSTDYKMHQGNNEKKLKLVSYLISSIEQCNNEKKLKLHAGKKHPGRKKVITKRN